GLVGRARVAPAGARRPPRAPPCRGAFSRRGTTATVICSPPPCAWPAAWPDEVPVPGTWQPVADNTNQADTRVMPDRRTIPPRPARALATTRPNEAPLIDRRVRITGVPAFPKKTSSALALRFLLRLDV